MPSPDHERFLRQALKLAARAAGQTRPNPMVGCVVVADGRVVGRGHHRRAGGPHAEIHALRKAGEAARGATLYVTLEPCCHRGRTGPCSTAIIEAGIARVVVGMRDPNPLVGGGGLAALRAAGIDVVAGVLEEECARLNEAWIRFITTGRPFVQLKLAASLDGHIATARGQSKWLTGPSAREQVHRVRAACDAIMVGSGTARADDPSLTARLEGKTPSQPTRVIVDSHCRLRRRARVFEEGPGGPVLVATTRAAERSRRESLTRAGAEVLVLPSRKGRVRLDALLEELGARDITSLLVEGGAELGTSLLAEGLVDKVLLFYAPLFLGSDARSMVQSLQVRKLEAAPRLERIRVQRFDEDVMVEGYPVREDPTCSRD